MGIVLGFVGDNGRENGNCYLGFRVVTWVFHEPHKISFGVRAWGMLTFKGLHMRTLEAMRA